jgi:uncharacterized repeat protein (TIGR01451 family)
MFPRPLMSLPKNRMGRGKRRIGFALCVALLVCAAAPASGRAAQVVGSSLANSANNFSCGSTGCTAIGTHFATGLDTVTAPSVIVAWRFRRGASGDMVNLRVAHPNPNGTMSAVGSSDQVSVPDSSDVVRPFALTRLQLLPGDLIGLRTTSNSVPLDVSAAAGATWQSFNSTWVDGGAPQSGTTPPASQEPTVQARVEPDADRDGFGDETQDACVGLTGSVNGCPRADLSLTTTAGQGTESAVVTYTLTAKNNGPDPVPDAMVSDTLPAGATFVPSDGSCSASGGSVRCPVGPLATGASSTVRIVALMKPGSQTNTATVSSAALSLAATRATGAGDPNPANDTASASVNVASPAVGQVAVSPQKFRLGSLLPQFSRRAPVGTTISFTLSQPAATTLTFSQPKTGRQVGKRCKTLTRANRRKPKCAIPNVRGTVTINGRAGLNRVRFQGRLSRSTKLKPGRYTVTITATDSAGNRSAPKTTGFTIVRG